MGPEFKNLQKLIKKSKILKKKLKIFDNFFKIFWNFSKSKNRKILKNFFGQKKCFPVLLGLIYNVFNDF